MKQREALTLKPRDLICPKVTIPAGGGRRWDIKRRAFTALPLPAGETVMFIKVIPKVRIVKDGPWNDSFDQLLLCQRSNGERAWINIQNAERVRSGEREAA